MNVFLLSLLIICSPMLFAQTPIADSYNGNTIGEDRRMELLHLLKQDCGSCHGLTFKGGLGPALLPHNLQNKPLLFLAETILNGRPGTPMPPWRGLLKRDEAMWLAGLLKRGVKP